MAAAAGSGPDSCAGKCGTWSDHCWCNEHCESHGDCCSDYQAVCQGSCPKCPGNEYSCDEWIQWDPSKYTCQNLQQDWGCNCTGCGSCGPAPPAGGGCPKCPGDRYNCDEWVQWDPATYSCASLAKDWGCNCTGCSRCGSAPPSPSTNAATLTLFDKERYPEARCLDGSMAGYYLRRGAADRFLIFLEGGGWCYDGHCENPTRNGTLLDCHHRAKQRLGSSRQWARVQDSQLQGLLSADPRANPAFHNWTLVYVPYCDGTSFSGDAVVGDLHFKGRAILRAVIDKLRLTTDIRKAKQVVLSGGSAGASAVYYHVDAVAEQLGLEAGEVLGLPDAGFFLDLPDKDGVDCWPAQMRSLFDVSNGYGGLHRGCLARFPQEQWKCLFPEYYADLISSRVLALNSYYDSSELGYTLRLKCCPGCGGPACVGRELQLFEALREQHRKAWAPLADRKGSGVWAPACVAHTMTWGKWTDTTWEVPAQSGNTQAAAVLRWLTDKDAAAHHFADEDGVPWPQNRPCAGSVVV